LLKPQVDVIVEDGVQDQGYAPPLCPRHVEWRNGHFVARTTGNQGSHIMTSLLNAMPGNAPEGGVEIRPGDTAKAIMLNWPEV